MISPFHACAAQFNQSNTVLELLCFEPQHASRCGDAAKATLDEIGSKSGVGEPPQNMG
jgi:hypothetical protein